MGDVVAEGAGEKAKLPSFETKYKDVREGIEQAEGVINGLLARLESGDYGDDTERSALEGELAGQRSHYFGNCGLEANFLLGYAKTPDEVEMVQGLIGRVEALDPEAKAKADAMQAQIDRLRND